MRLSSWRVWLLKTNTSAKRQRRARKTKTRQIFIIKYHTYFFVTSWLLPPSGCFVCVVLNTISYGCLCLVCLWGRSGVRHYNSICHSTQYPLQIKALLCLVLLGVLQYDYTAIHSTGNPADSVCFAGLSIPTRLFFFFFYVSCTCCCFVVVPQYPQGANKTRLLLHVLVVVPSTNINKKS